MAIWASTGSITGVSLVRINEPIAVVRDSTGSAMSALQQDSTSMAQISRFNSGSVSSN